MVKIAGQVDSSAATPVMLARPVTWKKINGTREAMTAPRVRTPIENTSLNKESEACRTANSFSSSLRAPSLREANP
jgi:hypothetical protein